MSHMKALNVMLAKHRHAWLGCLASIVSLMLVPEPASASCTYPSSMRHGEVQAFDSTFIRRRGKTAALYEFDVDGIVRSYPCPICPFYPPGLDKGKRVQLVVQSERIVAMGDEYGCQADESHLWSYRFKSFVWVLGLAAAMLLLSKILPSKRRRELR